MLFWITALALAALAAAALAWVLLRPAGRAARRAIEYDLAAYRAQLAEVDRDLARGLIDEAEAQAMRVEIKRRILEADRALAGLDEGRDAPRPLAVGLALGLAVLTVGGSALLYSRVGSPGLPDLPMAERLAASATAADRLSQEEAEARLGGDPEPRAPAGAPPNYLELVDKLRQAVAANPTSLKGQRLLAQHEAALGRFVAARKAQEQVVRLLGDKATSEDWSDLAEMMILAAGGYVSREAETALVRALRLDPRNGPARFYAGLLFLQRERPDMTLGYWTALLRDSRPDDPWVPMIRRQLPMVAELAGRPEAARLAAPMAGADALPGPDAQAMRDAANKSPEERQAMIRSMVARLDERLHSEGGTAAEWARLIRAFRVLGDDAKARATLAEAEGIFAGDAEALAAVRAAGEGLAAGGAGGAAGTGPAQSGQ